MSGKFPMVAAFDLLTCLLLVFVILAITQKPEGRPPTVETLGMVAITVRWGDGSNDDVDVYLRNPDGVIVYFAAPDRGGMHLEQDDLGTNISLAEQNGERIIVRAPVPGEYTANVHMYSKNDSGKQRVVIELWRLRGNDQRLVRREVVLKGHGDEETAFRFTLDARGNVSHINELPRDLVDAVSDEAFSTTPSGPTVPLNPTGRW